jgi:hypothetical protein
MPNCVTTMKLEELSESTDPDVASVAQELVRARKKLASYQESTEERSAIDSFISHMDSQGPLYDATHVPEQGDDPYYYELDARMVEPIVNLLRKS